MNISKLLPSLIASAALLTSQISQAASATWSATPTNGDWEAGAGDTNWSTGIGTFPGATSGLTNADTATFNQSNTTAITITSSTLNIRSINFGVGGATVANAFTIGSTVGNSLLLSSGGQIQIVNNSGTNSMTVNAPLVLEPASNITAGTYSFNNQSGSSSQHLIIGGSVTGGTTTQGITLTLTGSSASTGSDVQGVISDGGAALGMSLVKTSTLTWKLSNTNSSFTGGVSIQAGTLSAASIGNTGNNSSLGTNGTINIGLTTVGGTLNYTGTGETTNKVINMAGTSGGVTLAHNGTGNLVYSSNLTATGSGNKTLTFGGSTAGTIEFSGNIVDVGGVVSVTRAGTTGTTGTTGITILSGNNSYSGTTTVSNSPTNGGTLIMSGTNSSAGAISVSGGNLILNNASNGGLASGLLTMSNGSLQATTAGTATLSNAVTLSTGSGGFSVAGAQSITLNGDISFTGQTSKGFVNNMTGGAILTLNGSLLNLSAPTTNTYLSSGAGSTVINSVIQTLGGGGAGSLTHSGAGTLTLTNTNTYDGTTTVSGGTLQLNNTSAISASALVMSGGTLALRSDTNNDTFGATSRTLSASATINVDKLSTGSNNTLQLGALSVTAATTATLTVSGGNGYSLALGAVTQTPVTGTTLTIANSAPLTLASYTTNSNAATPKLTFSGTGIATITGNITQSGSGALALERATAAGTLILQGTSTMTGAVTISNGTIQTAVATNAFGSTTGISIGGSGTLALRGDSTTAFSNGTTAYPVTVTGSGATINVDQVSTGGATLTLGLVSMGNHQLVATGANSTSLTLGNFTNTQTASTPSITNNIAASGILTIGGYAFTANTGTTSLTFNGSGTTLVTGAVTQNAANAVGLTMNNAAGTTIFTGTNTNTGTNTITAGTIQIANNTTTGALGSGGITNNASLVFNRSNAVSVANNITGTGSVTQAGASSLTLGGTSTFSGGLNINSGSVISGSATTNGGIGTGTVTMANSTTLDLANNSFMTGLLSTSGDGTGVSVTNATGTAGIRTLTISGTGTQTFAGTISDGTATSLGLTKSGTGTQNLTGTVTYTGPTVLSGSGGTLGFTQDRLDSTSGISLGASTTLKYLGTNVEDLSSKLTVATTSSATIDFGANSQTYAGSITVTPSPAALVVTGTSGTLLTLSGSTNVFVGTSTGRLTVDTIQVDLDKSGTAGISGPMTIQNGGLLKLVGTNGNLIIASGLGGGERMVTVNTNGTFDANGKNEQLGGFITDATGVITNNAPSTSVLLTTTNSNTGSTILGTIQDGTGGGVLGISFGEYNVTHTLSGNNSHSGGTSIAQGTGPVTLALGSNTALGTGGLTLGSGSQVVTVRSTDVNARTLTNSVTLSATNTTWGSGATGDLGFGALTLNGGNRSLTVSNTTTTFGAIGQDAAGRGLTKLGTGTLVTTGTGTYTGATTITAGTLQLGNGSTGGTLSTSSAITNNATLAINRSNAVSQGTDFSGSAISGTGGITQLGGGVTTLTAANTYQGGTTISAGTLLANNTTGSATGTGAVTVGISGTLGGTGTISGAVNVSGTLAPGASPGTLDVGDTLSFSSGSTFEVEVGGNTPGDGSSFYDQTNMTNSAASISLTGTVTLSLSLFGGYTPQSSDIFYILTREDAGAFSTLFDGTTQGGTVSLGGGYTGTITYLAAWNGTQGSSFVTGGNDVAIFNVVPEPSTFAMLLGGFGMLLGFQRSRRRQ